MDAADRWDQERLVYNPVLDAHMKAFPTESNGPLLRIGGVRFIQTRIKKSWRRSCSTRHTKTWNRQADI